ncbi:MAG: pimeloyl-ACP methyl ester carboxylesterase [Myxococcota bacterium]|jgi:pimeloyl-ACP methyl ester carboxylesterase
MKFWSILLLAIALLIPSPAWSADHPPLDARLTAGLDYPHPVAMHALSWQGHAVELAYMDIAPTAPPIKTTVLLLHGKNFSGAYWAETITRLTASGHRVIVPDQIGFGRSSKPDDVQYSFHAMVTHTVSLLDALEVEGVAVVGHSMGGMVAARFALMQPERTERLVLMNPIGLEDWQQLTPYRTVEEWTARGLASTPAGVKAYMQRAYFDGQWKAEYDPMVALQAGWSIGPDQALIARVSALHYDMIYTQPVVHEFPRIQAPTLLIIGERDRTALNRDLVDEATAALLGRYDVLGAKAAESIPGAVLVALPGVGHVPQVEAPGPTYAALLSFLSP